MTVWFRWTEVYNEPGHSGHSRRDCVQYHGRDLDVLFDGSVGRFPVSCAVALLIKRNCATPSLVRNDATQRERNNEP